MDKNNTYNLLTKQKNIYKIIINNKEREIQMKNVKTKKQNLKMMNKLKNKTSGITLIALVVTVVVLLILASISIGVLTGEDGIIKQSQEAKEETEIAEERETVEISAVQAAEKDKWGEIVEENLAEELTRNIGERNTDYKLVKRGNKFIVTYLESNRSYAVDSDGNVSEYEYANLGKMMRWV